MSSGGGFFSMLENLAEALDRGPSSIASSSSAPLSSSTAAAAAEEKAPEVAPKAVSEQVASLAGIGAWWKTFDLQNKRRGWEEVGSQLASRQDKSAESRKALTEAVRQYRKIEDDKEKLEATEGLLKNLQDEIDSLTKRCRASDKAFLQIFADLEDAPDPVPCFQSAEEGQQRIIRLQEETAALRSELSKAFQNLATANSTAASVPKLKTEIAALEGELSKLSNQDITIRELEERISGFEATVEETVSQRLALREVELKRVFDAELEGIREAETAAEAQVRSLQALLAETAAARDEAQSQLAALEAAVSANGGGASTSSSSGAVGAGVGRIGGSGGATSKELEALHSENERLKATIVALTTQLQQVRTSQSEEGSGESASATGSSASSAAVAAYQARLSAVENELATSVAAQASLQEDVKQWQERVTALKQQQEKEASLSAQLLSRKEQELEDLNKELNGRPSTEDLQAAKRKLRALQRMVLQAALLPASSPELSDLQPSASLLERAAASTTHSESSATESSLEADAELVGIPAALIQSVGELREAVRAEVKAKKEQEAELEAFKKTLETAEAALAKQRERVAVLEEALVGRAVSGAGAGASGGAGTAVIPSSDLNSAVAASVTAEDEAAAKHLESLLSSSSVSSAAPGSEPLPTPALFPPPSPSKSSREMTGAASAAVGGGDALAILHGQREKLRARVRELEEELQRASSESLEAKVRAEKLLDDNVQLYAKIRYLESFKGQQQQQQAQSGGAGSGTSLADVAAGPGGASGGNGSGTDLSTVEPLQLLSFAVAGALRKSGLGGIAAPVLNAANAIQRKDAASARAASSSSTAVAVTGTASSSDVEAPYRQLYNEAHDPFADFRRREKARQIEKLSTAEQITLASSRFFLGNKAARTFLFFYLCGMHFLVFMTFWHFTHAIHDCSGGGGSGGGGSSSGASGAMQQRFLPTSLRGGTSTSPAPFAL